MNKSTKSNYRSYRKLADFLRRYIEVQQRRKKFARYIIPLADNTFTSRELFDVVKLFAEETYTMGRKVKEFETAFGNYVGCRYGIMTNSGSSALLVKFLALTHLNLGTEEVRKNEVIVPAIGWSTDYSSLWMARLKPVIVDIDRETLCISPTAVEAAVSTNTKAMLAIHMLGNPSPLAQLNEIAAHHNIDLLEDCCEAHGALFRGQHVGSIGRASVFSFYFSHHITTIEGGIMVTNDVELADLAYMIRAHGWIRDSVNKDKYVDYYKTFDPRFIFSVLGLNVRPTEIQGALGLIQLKKLDKVVAIRRKNASYLAKRMDEQLGEDLRTLRSIEDGSCSWFLFPIIKRDESRLNVAKLKDFVERRGIEVRPVTTGNIIRQPFFKYLNARVVGNLDNADYITFNSFCVGVHQNLTQDQCEYIIEVLKKGVKYAKP